MERLKYRENMDRAQRFLAKVARLFRCRPRHEISRKALNELHQIDQDLFMSEQQADSLTKERLK